MVRSYRTVWEDQRAPKKAGGDPQTGQVQTVISDDYMCTPPERAVAEAYLQREATTPPSPWVKVTRTDGVSRLGLDHPSETVAIVLLMEAVGASDVA